MFTERLRVEVHRRELSAIEVRGRVSEDDLVEMVRERLGLVG